MTDHDWQAAYNAGKRDAERELVEALRKIANGTMIAIENGDEWLSPLGARHAQEIAAAALNNR